MKKAKYALISVFDKAGIVEFARELVALGWTILSSGGTAKVLREAGIGVTDVATMVGKPILGHRVVTLSREIHAGLLARPIAEDLAELEAEAIPFIDMVVNDMYPLQSEIARPESTPESVIEKTDIGGPTLLRSAAKGRRIVVCDAFDRQRVIRWLKDGEPDREAFITKLVAKAEFTVAKYVMASAQYHSSGGYDGVFGKQFAMCKYGENASQTPAVVYTTGSGDPMAVDSFELVAGTAPSSNNWCDIDRLVQTITHIAASFDVNRGIVPRVAVAVKHGNPCGAAFSGSPEAVIWRVADGDPLAILGGFLMLNFPVTAEIAETILTHGMPEGARRLLDGIVAPSFDDDTIDQLKRKGDKCRLMVNPALEKLNRRSLDTATRFRYLRGGFSTQPNYLYVPDFNDPELKKYGQATPVQESDLLLAIAVCHTSNSNTVTLVKDEMLIGDGVGQQARVYGARLAITRARSCKHDIQGAVAASDSFFPETDGVIALERAGVKAVFTTSGSVRDKKVIKYCQDKGIVLYMIPDSKGRGFFGH